MATEEPIVATELDATVIVAADAVAPEEKVEVPAAGKPKKAKKISAKSKPRNPSLHPPYLEMIKEAIVTLKERTGSSQYAITKFIEDKQKNLPANFKKVLLNQLKKLVAGGKLVKVKASYKLPAVTAPAKKKPAAKPKSVTKKKAVAKPKPAPKVKAATKPKPKAAAPKSVAKPAAAKAKLKAKTPVKAAKVAKKSTRGSPGRKAPAAKPAVKKAALKSLKPKGGIAKKATAIRKVKK